MADVVTIVRPMARGDEALSLETMQALFPAAGRYRIEPMVKAVDKDPLDEWEAWFLRRLHEATRQEFTTAREAIWTVLDDVITKSKVRVPSDLDYWDLQENLFDLTTASTAHMVGLNVPRPVRKRLSRLGWSEREVLDFPALAYRFGRIYDELQKTGPVTPWEDLVARAKSYPLTTGEEASIEAIRRRAGVNLRPIMDQAGRVWTAEREIEPLREVLERHTRDRTGAREAARELGKAARAEGNFRDMDRVARTELAEASGNAAWDERSKTWTDETMLFRQTTRNACKDCLRLLKTADGMPRVYTKAEVERQDALGINTGPRETWHLRLGTIHPNCHPAGVVLDRPADLRTMMRRAYQGDLVTIRTASGRGLTVTPNHPVLTERGWVPASEVHQVGHVVTGGHRERMILCDADEEHVPTRVDDLGRSLGPHALMIRVAGTPDDFHGDGSRDEVDIVLQHSHLWGGFDANRAEHASELGFEGHGAGPSPLGLPRARNQRFGGVDHSSPSLEGVCSDCLSLRMRHSSVGHGLELARGADMDAGPLHPSGEGGSVDAVLSRELLDRALARFVSEASLIEHGGESVLLSPDSDAELAETQREGVPIDAVPAGQLLDRFAGFVQLDQVVNVDTLNFSGHVYSLETESHAYVASGVVVSNCVCPPWSRWMGALRSTFEGDAPEWAAKIKRLKVFPETA